MSSDLLGASGVQRAAMRGVPHILAGASPHDALQFRYERDGDPHWWARAADGLEVVLPGGAEGPDPVRLVLARQVLPVIAELERRAGTYLGAFLRNGGTPEEEDQRDAWEPVWLEFGASRHEPLDRFTLYLTRPVSDADGLYHVTFRLHAAQPASSVPVAFGRREW